MYICFILEVLMKSKNKFLYKVIKFFIYRGVIFEYSIVKIEFLG